MRAEAQRRRTKASRPTAMIRARHAVLAMNVSMLAACVNLGRIDEVSVKPHYAASFEQTVPARHGVPAGNSPST